jgi:hypothetical protein
LLIPACRDGIALWSLDGRQLIARALPRGDASFAVANADSSRVIANASSVSPPAAWNIAVDPPVRMPFVRRPAYALFAEDGKVIFTKQVWQTLGHRDRPLGCDRLPRGRT